MNGSTITAGPFYGTFREHWPESVAELSIPDVGASMSEDDTCALLAFGGALGGFGQNGWKYNFSESLSHWIADGLRRFSGGVFLRLGGRSFVHSTRGPRRTRTVQDAFELLMDPGYRATRMALRCRFSGRPIWLFAREWRDIAPSDEFRLFIRRRRLAGVSQYHHKMIFAELVDRSNAIVEAISDFASRLSLCLHLSDVVADVIVEHRDQGLGISLLELNPFMLATGGALFEACSDGALDGTFRFRTTDGGRIVSLALASGRRCSS